MSKHSDSEILKKTSLWDMASTCFCCAHPSLKFLALSLSLATRWISWAQLLSQSPKMSTVCSSLLPSGFQKRRGLVGSMAGWASGSQIPRTTADVCLSSFCSVNNFSRYLYDTWCAVLLVVQILSLWKFFLPFCTSQICITQKAICFTHRVFWILFSRKGDF